MKTFFVVNPASASGATGHRWAELSARIASTLSDFEVKFTAGPMDAVKLTRSAVKHGWECIVAIGGDGTINEVVNGLFEDDRIINPNIVLGILPRGTGGDFCKTFHLSFQDALRQLQSNESQLCDVGRLEFVAHDGAQRIRYFVNVCGFGVSGIVVDKVRHTTKILGGTFSFMWASLQVMSRYTDRLVHVSFDGAAPETLKITNLAVANGKFFGGGMKVAPDADVCDGKFDVTIWSGYTVKDLLLKSAGMYSGAHVRWKGTRTLRCHEVVAQSDERVFIDCDGEQPGRLPCRMTILPAAIRLNIARKQHNST